MEDVYKGIPQLSIYMDDISAMGDETEDHLKTIKLLLTNAYDLPSNPKV